MKRFLRIAAIFLTITALSTDAMALSTSATASALIELSSGDIIFSENADKRLPMASTTKIMTALVALENADISDNVKIPPAAVGVEGSSIYLSSEETLTLEELLYAMMLESANDAAAAIAIHVGGSVEGFADMMNRRATEIGCENTHFTNPHGLDSEDHYTTAKELAMITAEAMKNGDFRRIVSTVSKTVSGHDGGIRYLHNHNRLLREGKLSDGGNVIGVKTGFTKRCGRCLVSAAERDGVTVIAVTIADPDDWNDHRAMLTHGLSAYKCHELVKEGSLSFAVPVIGGDASFVTAVSTSTASIILPSDKELFQKVILDRFYFAPIQKGDALGEIQWTDSDGNTVISVPLTAQNSVNKTAVKKSLFDKIFN